MCKIILVLLVSLVFEDSQKIHHDFPVYPGSVLVANHELLVNGEKAEVCVFESVDIPENIKSYIISRLIKDGWNKNSTLSNLSLSFSKGNINIKVQIVRSKNKTKIIFYKNNPVRNGISNRTNLDKKGEDFSDIPRYPNSKRILFVKRLTGFPVSTTIGYETLDASSNIISFYKNNMRLWRYVKLDKDEEILCFSSRNSWCVITARRSKDKTVLIIVKYEGG